MLGMCWTMGGGSSRSQLPPRDKVGDQGDVPGSDSALLCAGESRDVLWCSEGVIGGVM